MLIDLNRNEKIELLNAIKTGVLNTSRVPALQKVLNEVRPDIRLKNMSDSELDVYITELENKIKR